MALSGSQLAYLYARSKVARSGATRSNYVQARPTIAWIIRDDAGNIISTTDISDLVLLGSAHIVQALNDEPDTCSFDIGPQPAATPLPAVGDEISIAWTTGPPSSGVTLFYGYVVTIQKDWRLGAVQPPWLSIQCQDSMWRFDARLVTYRFPTQSATASIEFIVQWFCNNRNPHPLNFNTNDVAPGMPSVPTFEVINQRPSTVLRTLTAAVAGGFYIEGLNVHAWANSVSEPNQTNPIPLTVGTASLKAVRLHTDITQMRKRVFVEGKRTSTLTSIPDGGYNLGVPVEDASIFATHPYDPNYALARMGNQWMYCDTPVTVTANGAQPPQAKVAVAFLVGPSVDRLFLAKMATVPPPLGWIRVGNQYARYDAVNGNPLTGQFWLQVWPSTATHGKFTEDIPIGETVEWVDCISRLTPHGHVWAGTPYGQSQTGSDPLHGHPSQTPIVILSYHPIDGVSPPASKWPPLEGFVQDGRYSYTGAQARAVQDIATFQDPLETVEWITEDVNALPGRSQVIALSGPTITPPINKTVTILRVEITFPLRTIPPRRVCTGGVVKPSSYLDLVVTADN